MANIPNPRKKFQFGIIIIGPTGPLNPFLAQEVDLPDIGFEIDTHGDTNYDVKTAGKVTVDKLMIKKISPTNQPDPWVWTWVDIIMNSYTGGGALPSIYKRSVIVNEFAIDGITVVNSHTLDGVWPSKVNGKQLRRTESGNLLEEMEFEVDRRLHT